MGWMVWMEIHFSVRRRLLLRGFVASCEIFLLLLCSFARDEFVLFVTFRAGDSAKNQSTIWQRG